MVEASALVNLIVLFFVLTITGTSFILILLSVLKYLSSKEKKKRAHHQETAQVSIEGNEALQDDLEDDGQEQQDDMLRNQSH